MLLCFGSHSMEEEDPVWCDGVVRTVCRFESWLGQQIVTVFGCPEVTLYSWQDVKIQSLMELLPSSLYSQGPRCLVLQMRWEVTVTSSVCVCVCTSSCASGVHGVHYWQLCVCVCVCEECTENLKYTKTINKRDSKCSLSLSLSLGHRHGIFHTSHLHHHTYPTCENKLQLNSWRVAIHSMSQISNDMLQKEINFENNFLTINLWKKNETWAL